jgi:hypothetical protein
MNLAATIDLYAGRKLHKRLKFQGLDVSVENRAGSVRRGTDPSYGPWSVKMSHDYGYIKGSKGMDGGGVDCFIGPNSAAKMAYVVHIRKTPKFQTFDEDKCMLGFNSKAEAKAAFMKNYNDKRFYGGMDVIPMAQFKKKVMETAQTGPHKIEAWGEPQVYDGGYQHIADTQIMFHPPSLKNPKPIPTDDPMEKDDSFLDVTKRKDAATKKFRDRLTKQHTDSQYRPLHTQLVSGFPAVGVGGFG